MAYAFDPKDDVETQWKKWSAENPANDMPFVDENELKQTVIKDLTYVSRMDVKEYTLYQKWCEVQDRYPAVIVNDLKNIHFIKSGVRFKTAIQLLL